MVDYIAIENKLPLGAFSTLDMECIYPALKAMKASDLYLEVGVDKGKSLAFARKVSKGNVFGIDIRKNPRVKGTKFIHKVSNEAVKTWEAPIKVLFIDGNHTYEGCKDDWDNFSPFVVRGGWVFFHDCDATSPGVEKVFGEIGKGWKDKKIYKAPSKNTSMSSVRKT